MRSGIPGLLGAVAVATLAASAGVQGSEDEQARALYQSQGCVACHAETGDRVGPSYERVAERYSIDDLEQLIARVREGGSGNWGDIPMPPHQHVSEEDVETLVRWILTLE